MGMGMGMNAQVPGRPSPSNPSILCFDGFELHLDSGELFRTGIPIRLQPQPARVLEILARRPGEVVRREEIQAFVWGEETFLDADASLNFCIKQIRRALDDPASSPRYIETIPRRGYRFLVPVEVRSGQPPAALVTPEPELAALVSPPPPEPASSRHARFLGLAASLGLLALGLLTAMQRPTPPVRPGKTGTATLRVPPAAREHYLSALYLRGSDSERARQELREALLLAPDFAEAHAMLAWVESQEDRSSEHVRPEPELTARRAIALDPELSRAHLALGHILLHDKLDWKNGEAELRRAVELDPGSADAWHALASPLAALGRHEEAIAAVQRSRELDPAGMVINSDLAWFLYLARQYEEANRQATRALDLARARGASLTRTERTYVRWAWRTILFSARQTGDRRAGLEAARELLAAYRNPTEAERLSTVEEYWLREREWLLGMSRKRQVPAALFAFNAATAGEYERALAYLDQACQQKWLEVLLSAAVDPVFDPLRGNPRFERFLDCIGVPADAPARRR